MAADPFYAAADGHRVPLGAPAPPPPLQPHPAVAGALPTYNHVLVSSYRDASTAPLRKLSVDLIKTYKFINEVHSRLPLVACRGGGTNKMGMSSPYLKTARKRVSRKKTTYHHYHPVFTVALPHSNSNFFTTCVMVCL